MVLGIVLGQSIESYFRQSATIGFSKIAGHPVAVIAMVAGLAMLVIFYKLKEKVQED
jgi:TctA family transporter